MLYGLAVALSHTYPKWCREELLHRLFVGEVDREHSIDLIVSLALENFTNPEVVAKTTRALLSAGIVGDLGFTPGALPRESATLVGPQAN